jgi:hypothetical protein
VNPDASPRHASTPTGRLSVLSPVGVTLMIAFTGLSSSCSAEQDLPTEAGPSSHSASPSPSPAVDPASEPTIDDSYAVDGDRKLALACWGEGSPTVLLRGQLWARS